MANNRDEFKAEVDNLLVAKVTIAGNHKPMIKDELADSIHFKKDVIGATQVVIASGVVTVDFSDKDLAVLNAVTNNCSPNITISNLDDGDDGCYIKITKNSSKNVAFANATNLSRGNAYYETTCIYKITSKGGVYYAELLNGLTQEIVIAIGDWDMDTNGTWTYSFITNPIVTFAKVIGWQAVILDDASSGLYDLTLSGFVQVTGLGITLYRTAGGTFDTANYNATSFNRGYVTLKVKF